MKQLNNCKRDAGIEILRIIATVLVIIHHVFVHGGLLEYYDLDNMYGFIVSSIIEGYCQVCVNIFVLISGYFLVNSRMRWGRIIKFILQTEFFAICCIVLGGLVLDSDLSITSIIKGLFPLTSNQWWFATKYIVLLMLLPYINKLIHSLSKKQYIILNLTFATVFSFIPTFLNWSRDILGRGYEFTWILALYFVGAYLKLYVINHRKPIKWIMFFVVLGGVIGLSRIMIALLTDTVLHKIIGMDMFFNYNNILVFMLSLCLFWGFVNFSINNKLLINISRIGKYSFGAYLISDMAIIRSDFWLYFDVLNKGILENICLILMIFLFGCLLEYIRVLLFQLVGAERVVIKIKNIMFCITHPIINLISNFSE